MTAQIALGFGLSVLVIGTIALMLKLMIFALALDDWFELRGTAKEHPEKMVADDEVIASAVRVGVVIVSVVIGLMWVLTIIMRWNVTPLLYVLAGGLLLQALLALFNGARSMFFRRAMARVLNKSRRPVSSLMEPRTQIEDHIQETTQHTHTEVTTS